MTAERSYDVAVIGGGPNGIAFALWLKQLRPPTTIAVLEKQAQPGFKIGERKLAPTVEAILSLGLDLPLLRSLFQIKTSPRFWPNGGAPNPDEVGLHVNASDFDETFQLERSVFEELLHLQAERRGIEVHRATTVDMARSSVEGPDQHLQCVDGDGRPTMVVRAPLIVDASGPAAVIPRHLGLYKRAGDDLNYNAYFAYFRKKDAPPSDVPHWNVSATRHVHFPEGWVWFINITSWEGSRREDLRAMMEHLTELPPQEGPEWPTRLELSERFGCPVENVM